MMTAASDKEREILMVMRKVLAAIIKDTTPPHRGIKHPLSERTIEDVRLCLGLISARERELAEQAGVAPERPYYSDEPPAATLVSLSQVKKRSTPNEEG
jgi:hypothetical protein